MPFDHAQAVKLFTQDHLTTRQIGELLGVSNTSIWRALQAQNIKAHDGEHVKEICLQCKKPYELYRWRWKRSDKHFCSHKCYTQSLHNPQYKPNREGQRKARLVVSKHFELKPEHVVHHVDGDNLHNGKVNLWVFATQADHIAWHRGNKEVQPIWKD